jgi:hypothetical protein
VSSNPFGDNANPYQTPGGPAMGYGGPPPLSKVQGPAIGLMVVGGIGFGLGVLGIVLNLLGVGLGAAAAANNGDAGFEAMMRGVGGLVGGIVGLAINGLILYGGMQMKSLQSYGLAMAASILAILPCSCACIIGIPIGIWSLVTLNDPTVKASFR